MAYMRRFHREVENVSTFGSTKTYPISGPVDILWGFDVGDLVTGKYEPKHKYVEGIVLKVQADKDGDDEVLVQDEHGVEFWCLASDLQPVEEKTQEVIV